MLMVGCVSTSYNYSPEHINISEPPLDTVVIANIGDSMLRQGKYAEHDAIYIEVEAKAGILGYTLTKGYYLKKGENKKSEFYLPSDGPDSGHVIKDVLVDPFQIIRLDKKTGKLCAVSVYGIEACTNKANYEKKKYPVSSKDSFQQTLIYSGKVGDKINVSYREFSDNFARPAFSNEVEYDMSESSTIGYKGAKIEVIEATNEFIKYRVLQNFNAGN